MCFCQAKGLPKLFAMCTQPASASMARYTGWGKRDPPPAHVPGGDPSPTEEVHGLCLPLSPPPPGISSGLLLRFLPHGGYSYGDLGCLTWTMTPNSRERQLGPSCPLPLSCSDP